MQIKLRIINFNAFFSGFQVFILRSMSQTTKRKHVTKEVLQEFVLPDNETRVVKVLAGRGNNLHQVLDQNGQDTFLASMPNKFRKNVWIKRGDFVLINNIPEGDKVKGEIVHILYKPQIKYIKSQGLWPQAFNTIEEQEEEEDKNLDLLPPTSDDSDNDDDLFQNTNRQVVELSEDSSSEEEEEQ